MKNSRKLERRRTVHNILREVYRRILIGLLDVYEAYFRSSDRVVPSTGTEHFQEIKIFKFRQRIRGKASVDHTANDGTNIGLRGDPGLRPKAQDIHRINLKYNDHDNINSMYNNVNRNFKKKHKNNLVHNHYVNNRATSQFNRNILIYDEYADPRNLVKIDEVESNRIVPYANKQVLVIDHVDDRPIEV